MKFEWEPVLCAKCNMFGYEDTFCRGSQSQKKVWVPKVKPPDTEQPVETTVTKAPNERQQVKGTESVETEKLVVVIETTSNTNVASGSARKEGRKQKEELIDKGAPPHGQ